VGVGVGVGGAGAIGCGPTPPPPPPQAETLNASTNAQAVDPNSRFVMNHSPLKPLKTHGFPTDFMV
jgi:hypothetical protein